MLLVFGVSGLVGAALAGRAADTRGASNALKGALALVVVSLVGFGVAARVSGETGLVVSTVAIVLYGVGTWAVTPPQQQRLVRFGGNERLLLSLNASALYAGVAAGSALGGLVLASTRHVFLVCFVGAGISLAALALTVAGDSFTPRGAANSNAV
jgi:predicted MFS family arabinose efflux permease